MDTDPNYKIFKIQLETVYGQSSEMDSYFTEYLDEYSIAHVVLESEGREFPLIEYSGGPISLSNMLKEKFGYSMEEIRVQFPEIGNELFE